MIEVKPISARETYPVRLQVLRKGLALKDCVFNRDEDINTHHLGLFKDNLLIGVASYMKNTSNFFNITEQYQLRGMAILENHQGKNYGNLLLEKGERILKQLKTDVLWFNAREIAVNFYKRNNYETIGEFFNIEGVGTHIVMFKELKQENKLS